jgi:hypothetical protein
VLVVFHFVRLAKQALHASKIKNPLDFIEEVFVPGTGILPS